MPSRGPPFTSLKSFSKGTVMVSFIGGGVCVLRGVAPKRCGGRVRPCSVFSSGALSSPSPSYCVTGGVHVALFFLYLVLFKGNALRLFADYDRGDECTPGAIPVAFAFRMRLSRYNTVGTARRKGNVNFVS